MLLWLIWNNLFQGHLFGKYYLYIQSHFNNTNCFVFSKSHFHHYETSNGFIVNIFKDPNPKMLENMNYVLVLNSLT